MAKEKSSPKAGAQKSLPQTYLRRFYKWFLLPVGIYLGLFFFFQPHYLGNFSHGFYLDSGDGFQNVWNIWWVDESIVGRGDSPYFTNLLHWPYGTSLLPQTMNIINGLVAIPLMHVFGFSLVEATNFAVLSAFALGGVTMFWFIYKLIGKYWIAVIAGGLFTFSTYHTAHALGHLQLVTFQFIPLFLLAFWTLLEKMRYRYAVGAAGALFLVLLSDYYYLFWSVMVGALWFAWQLYRKELKITKQSVRVLGLFAVLSAVLIGPLIIGLVLLNKRDPLVGFHDPKVFVLDPFSVIIPGGTWYWKTLTVWYWPHLPFAAEANVFFGFGLITLLAIAFYKSFIKKRNFKPPVWLNFWWIVLFMFAILALGPRLKMFGRTLDRVPLPYEALETVFPTLKISGMPVRWVLVSLIAAIVIGSYILSKLDLKSRKGQVLLALFLVVSFIDLRPSALPLTLPEDHTQPYVAHLKALPYGAVIDNGAVSASEQLFHQTIDEKPMAFGYVTRLPKSIDEKDFHIFAALEEGRYDELCRTYKIRYVTTPAFRPIKGMPYPVIYNDNQTIIYDLKNSENC